MKNNQFTKEIRNVTIAGAILNLILATIKILVGHAGKSQSVFADGIHSLSDCSTDIILLIGLNYWNEPPDQCHPYGHRRIETIVAFLIGFILFLAAGFIGYEAVSKFQSGTFLVPTRIALLAAVLSIIVKEALYQWTVRLAERINSSALKANAWHHRTDSLSSIAVSIAIGITLFYPDMAILDPVAALIVSVFIAQAAYSIVKPALVELADAGADPEAVEKITRIAMGVTEVCSVHAVRTRFHGPGLRVDLHVQVKGNLTVCEGHNISGKVKKMLLEEGPDVIDVLVHIEPCDHSNDSSHTEQDI